MKSQRLWEWDLHLRHIADAQWLPMQGPDGKKLPGIWGMKGVRGEKSDGSHIGFDFIYMQPGSRFPLHTHHGDHEIYFISGNGFVHVNGKNIAVASGHMIHVPAEYPHGVWVEKTAALPLIFVAAGHPHQDVHSRERMQLIENRSVPQRTPAAALTRKTETQSR